MLRVKLIAYFLICALTVQEGGASCEDSVELESNCGYYCYKVVKPLLEHVNTLQHEVASCKHNSESSTEARLRQIEQLLRSPQNNLNSGVNADPQQIQQVITPNNYCEHQFPIRIGNKFYHVETNLAVNWHQAVNNCRKLGGNLLNIESSGEMDAILSILPKVPLNDSRYWISSNCLAGNREFISITTGEPMPYNRWQQDEPNNAKGEESCVELGGSALNDANCAWGLKYICEAKLMS